jgi:DNA-binding transcriptional LysR family regulator
LLDPAPREDTLGSIEFRHLAALKAVGDERSFRGAADALGYVQSAVSHQIAALERSVGARLVDRQRGNKPVSLTASGEILLAHSERILHQVNTAQARLSALAEGRAGTLRVGAFQSASVHLLPRVTGEFAARCPDFQLALTEAQNDTRLLSLLDEDRLDLIFAEEPCPADGLERAVVSEDPYVVVVPDDCELAAREDAPSLDEVCRQPLIGFNASRGQDALLDLLERRGIAPKFAVKVDLISTVAPLVAAGLGLAIVPYLTLDAGYPGTAVLEVPELPRRRIVLAWRSDRQLSEAGARFVEIARGASRRFGAVQLQVERQPS